ncbi:hypothetical protein PS15p_210630 [Mucor circinelloides]
MKRIVSRSCESCRERNSAYSRQRTADTGPRTLRQPSYSSYQEFEFLVWEEWILHARVMAHCTGKQKKRLSMQTLNLAATALPLLQEPPEPLNGLLNGTCPKSPHVLKKYKAIQHFVCFYIFWN